MSQSFNVLKEIGSLTLGANGNLNVGGEGQGATMSFDGVDTLNIDGGNTGDVVNFGENTQVDVVMSGATDVLFDQSTGGLTNGGYIGLFTPDAALETIAGGVGGAIDLDTALTNLETDGTDDNYTLGPGSVVGQVKCIVFRTDGGGDAIVTPSSYEDGTTITFGTPTHFAILVWNGTAWRTILNVGGTIA